MKVVWLIPPVERAGYPNVGQNRFYKNMPIKSNLVYPYLAAMGVTELEQVGFEAKFIDAPTERRPITDALDADVVIIEGRTPTITDTWKTAEAIKHLSGAKIILYGDHVTHFPEESLAKPGVDCIACGGDYDAGITDLCKRYDETGNLPKQEAIPFVQNLDQLPFPDREATPWRNYSEAWKDRDVFLWTMSGRGCHYSCIFCSWSGTLWHHQVRQRTPLNVAREFKTIYNQYGKYEILDDHDCFPTAWGAKFAKELLNMGLGPDEVLWEIQTHSNEINNLDNLKLLHKSGLKIAKLGIETGNQSSLTRMRKGTTVEQHEKAVRLLKEAGILVHMNMMVGWPWETKAEAYHTIEWVKKLDPAQAQFSLVIPYPNTELYEMAKANGWLLVKEGDWNSFDASYPMMTMEGMTTEEVVQLYRDCWDRFYLNWHYKWNHLKTVRSLDEFLRLIRGYYSVRFGHMRAVKNK